MSWFDYRRRAVCLALASTCTFSHALEVPLPDLGDSSAAELSSSDEQQIGASAMREIRRSGLLVDDPELSAYLNELGWRLVDASGDTLTSFRFLPLRDDSINAFAVPGGVIGVHTGLIVMAQHESELASVLAHEVAHISQQHIARMLEGQRVTPWMTLAALGLAILAARAGAGDAATAMAAAGPALAMRRQLDYTYAFEQEADRVGIDTLTRAGFDPNAMAGFFQRLQRHNQLVEHNAPEFLRTHPVTYKRISDAQSRARKLPYKQVQDSADFLFMREKARLAQMKPSEAVEFYRQSLGEGRYRDLAAHQYGYALALLGVRQFDDAATQLAASRKTLGRPHAVLDALEGRLLMATGEPAEAAQYFADARARFSGSRALVYGEIDALIASGELGKALVQDKSAIELYPSDAALYQRQAKIYQAQGLAQLQYKAQAEYYIRLLEYTAAIEQLQIAQKQPGTDFYVMSEIDARLKELQEVMAPRNVK
ncbi:M48 family metalloprotease [Chitinibacteraceae bacterium HSL-7]